MDSPQELCWLAVDELEREPPFPPREDRPTLDFLTSSVRLHGVLAPLLVRRLPEGRYQVVCGWRRLLAAREAEVDRLPCLVRELGSAEAIRCYLTENTCRSELTELQREETLDVLRDLRREEESRPAARTASAELGPAASPVPPAATTPPEPLVEELVERTRSFHDDVRKRRRIDCDRALDIVDRLLTLPGRLQPVPVDAIRAAVAAGDDWLAPHALLSASLHLCLAPRDITALGRRGYALAGLLHDVGMVFVRPEILASSRPLAPSDRKEVRSHPRVGHALIAATGKDWAEVALAARDHHERLDGSGYPGGARGDTVGRLARVAAVADSFASMVAPRPFRPAWGPQPALERLARATEEGLYDPALLPELQAAVASATPEPDTARDAALPPAEPSRNGPPGVEFC